MVHQNELTQSDNISSFAREHVLKQSLSLSKDPNWIPCNTNIYSDISISIPKSFYSNSELLFTPV